MRCAYAMHFFFSLALARAAEAKRLNLWRTRLASSWRLVGGEEVRLTLFSVHLHVPYLLSFSHFSTVNFLNAFALRPPPLFSPLLALGFW